MIFPVQKSLAITHLDEVQMHLMRQTKKIFEPNNILNAGKIFD